MKTATSTISTSTSAIADRIEGFDLLRGLCAIAVAFYHILWWRDQVSLDGIGRYCVYVFFVLSGASMFIAYNHKFAQGYDAGKFIALRFLRLAPLLCMVLALTAGLALVKHQPVGHLIGDTLLNISFAFGLGNPGSTSAITGGWSLGIEFVFYLVFPVLLAATQSRAWLLMLVLSFVLQHVFVNRTLGGASLATAWVTYTQPLSFAFYFMAGCCIGRVIQSGAIRYSPLWVFGFAAAALPLLSVHSEDNLLGVNGVMLSLSATALALCSSGLPTPGFASTVADALGRLSYGVYLIHPLAFGVVNRLLMKQPTVVVALTTIAVSSVAALVLERYYEAPVRSGIRKLMRI
ncbi:acyltransferase [Massilia pinisoli]|uniref:Acyltransferase n=1 Tax=Massilia pinisoli TaxID=1772194 RepID=A0ABT1ZNN3_9BURK|nr:acyltransferase [Massilia pinisoli]MCS0581314.1 acyltransferase [Massilia pinisoli]